MKVYDVAQGERVVLDWLSFELRLSNRLGEPKWTENPAQENTGSSSSFMPAAQAQV